jgi:uncharacterized alpha-E superfamily protein
MSRYLERAEHMARLLDVNMHGLVDQSPESAILRRNRLLKTFDASAPPSDNLLNTILLDRTHPNSILSCIASARENARHVREQISSEMWEQVNRLYLYVNKVKLDDITVNPNHYLTQVKKGVQLFHGITDSTLSHSEGWHFILVGKYMERATSIMRLLEVFLETRDIGEDQEVALADYDDWVGLLKSCTAFEAYCRAYQSHISAPRIVSYLVLDQTFPHSVRFSADIVKASLADVSEVTGTQKVGNVNRLSGKISAMLNYASIDDIRDHPILFLRDIQRQYALLDDSIYTTYINYPVETGL